MCPPSELMISLSFVQELSIFTRRGRRENKGALYHQTCLELLLWLLCDRHLPDCIRWQSIMSLIPDATNYYMRYSEGLALAGV